MKYYSAASFHILTYIPLSLIFAAYIHYNLCIKKVALNNAKKPVNTRALIFIAFRPLYNTKRQGCKYRGGHFALATGFLRLRLMLVVHEYELAS